MDAYTLLPAVLADRSNMHAGHQGDDEWRRCRLLLQVHRLGFSHGGDLQKLPDGMQSRPLVDLPLADGESCAVSKQVTKIPIVPV